MLEDNKKVKDAIAMMIENIIKGFQLHLDSGKYLKITKKHSETIIFDGINWVKMTPSTIILSYNENFDFFGSISTDINYKELSEMINKIIL